MLRWMGFLLLLSGWGIAMAALVLLTGVGERYGFVLAALMVEALGVGLLARESMLSQREAEERR